MIPAPTPASTHKLPPVLWRFLVACIAITIFSWVFAHFYYQHTRLENASLWSHDPTDAFGDFSHYVDLFPSFHTADFWLSDDRFAYPAPAAVVYFWLFSMGPYQLAIFLGAIIASALLSAGLFIRKLLQHGISPMQATLFTAGTVLSSWPLLFLYERANLELVIWILAALGVWALLRNHPILAGVLFGLTASIKVYPLVLLALLFSHRHRWAFLTGMATFGLSMLLAFWFVGPTIPMAFHGALDGVLGFVGNYAATAHSELRFDHSFLAAIKQLTSHHVWMHTDFSALSHIYVPVVAVGATLLFLLRVNSLPLINRILFVMICMVALPPVSYDYTLVHLYVPFALIALAGIRAANAHVELPGFKPALACFAVLFTPQLFLFYGALNLNGVLKSTALAGLIVLLARHPFPDPEWPVSRAESS